LPQPAPCCRSRDESGSADRLAEWLLTYGYELFFVDESYFQSIAKSPRDYVVLNNWDFVAFASGLGVRFARTVNTAAAFDAALTNAAAFNGPALIAAQVDRHGLPAELP
jgi:indolepyruvate decarboxylase